MKLYEVKKIAAKANRRISNRRISKDGIATLCLFYKIDKIPSFDTCPPEEDSIFIRLRRIRFFKVSSTISLDARGRRESRKHDIFFPLTISCQL